MISDIVVDLLERFVTSISDKHGLKILLSDNGKYILSKRGQIVAEVNWVRYQYREKERRFDSYAYTVNTCCDGKRSMFQVMNKEGSCLLVDTMSIVWKSNYTEYATYFENCSSYMTDTMIREFYDVDSPCVRTIN